MAEKSSRDRIYEVTGRFADTWPLSNVSRPIFRARHNILYYHAVWPEGDERLRLFGGVSLERFASDIDRLGRFFRFASLDEIFADPAASDGTANPRPSICVTFDDGFDLVAGGAAKFLADRGISATAFVNTDGYQYARMIWQHGCLAIRSDRGDAHFVEHFNAVQKSHDLGEPISDAGDFLQVTRHWPYARTLEFADEVWSRAGMPPSVALIERLRPYMDLECLKRWTGLGHSVGFHGRSHLWSSSLDAKGLREEFLEPGRQLHAELGGDALYMSYGFGDRLGPELEQAALEAGIFKSALGADGLTRHGDDVRRAERLSADDGLSSNLYGRTILKMVASKLLSR